MNRDGLEVEHLEARQGGFLLRDITLTCRPGEYHVLLGPTGSGKSTILKSILGLIPSDAGAVRLGGRVLDRLPPEERRLGYLPQHQLLFPHLDVQGNLAFGATRRGVDRQRLDELARRFNLHSLFGRHVASLSGGERQKVALARALASSPEALLCDEPFSALDEGNRRHLWFEMKEAIRGSGLPVLHVTHSLDEAATLGDRVSLLVDGKIVQQGPSEEILERPATEAVASYLGYRNIFTGTAESVPGGTRLVNEDLTVFVPGTYPGGRSVRFCLRPQDIKIVREDAPLRPEIAANVFPAKVESLLRLPDYALVRLWPVEAPADFTLEMKIPLPIMARYALSPGLTLRAAIWTPGIIVWT